MKKFINLLMCIFILSTVFSVNVFAASDVSVYVDKEFTQLTDAYGNPVYPFIKNGTTYIPVRGISQALGCIVEWDGDNNNVLIYKDIDVDVKKFRNGSDDIKLYVDNVEQTLYDANGNEVKPIEKNGTTYVPLRGVSKVLGYPVDWEGSTKSVYVWKDLVPPQGVTLDFLRPSKIDAPVGGMEILYESEGKYKNINGEDYTNTIWGVFGTTFFNLNGKYDTLKCVLGPVYESTSDDSATVSFIVDGKIVQQLTITPDSFNEEINIPLNKGLQLKILLNPNEKENNYLGLGDIKFFGSDY